MNKEILEIEKKFNEVSSELDETKKKEISLRNELQLANHKSKEQEIRIDNEIKKNEDLVSELKAAQLKCEKLRLENE